MESVALASEPASVTTTLEAWSSGSASPSTSNPRPVSATRACCGRASCRPSAHSRLDGSMIRLWVAEMHTNGLSASRIKQSYRLLRQILASAVDCGLLERDPSRGVKMPHDVRREMSCLTAEEVERLADAALARYRPLVHVLAYGGLRWGEATALRRHRCDLDAGRLIVAESLADVSGRAVFGQTKTYRVRKTRIPDFLVHELRAHLETVDLASDALVFTAPRGGPLGIANFRQRVWWPALDAASLPRSIRIHDMRHTCASLLIRQGVHPKAIQHHLGHSSINITMDRYGHLLPDQYDDLASQLDAAHDQGAAPSSGDGRVDQRGPADG